MELGSGDFYIRGTRESGVARRHRKFHQPENCRMCFVNTGIPTGAKSFTFRRSFTLPITHSPNLSCRGQKVNDTTLRPSYKLKGRHRYIGVGKEVRMSEEVFHLPVTLVGLDFFSNGPCKASGGGGELIVC